MRLMIAGLALALLVSACSSVPERAPEQVPPEEAPPEQPILDPTEEAYESISLAMSIGNPDDAIAAYQQAELEDPDAPETQVLLANLYLAAGDPSSARAILEGVVDGHPDNAEALLALALLEGFDGERRRERELLRQAVEADPANPQAQAALGESELRDRDYDDAERAFRASLEQDPENLVAMIGLGNVKLRTEEPEQAEEILTIAIETAPEYSFAYADRSRARAMQFELGEALQDLDQAIELDPDYLWHRYDRGLVRLERNDFEGAVEDFSWVIARDPGIFLAYVYRARAWDRQGRRSEAIADYEAALNQRPDYHPGYAPLAVLYFEEERYADAAAFFRRAWDGGNPNDPRDHGFVFLAAGSWKMAGETRRAIDFVEDAAPELPRPGIWYDMARYYIRPMNDGFILRQVRDEDDRFLKTRMQFYLGLQYESADRPRSAASLYREVAESELQGFIETRLAATRLATLETPQ